MLSSLRVTRATRSVSILPTSGFALNQRATTTTTTIPRCSGVFSSTFLEKTAGVRGFLSLCIIMILPQVKYANDIKVNFNFNTSSYDAKLRMEFTITWKIPRVAVLWNRQNNQLIQWTIFQVKRSPWQFQFQLSTQLGLLPTPTKCASISARNTRPTQPRPPIPRSPSRIALNLRFSPGQN